MPEHPSAGSERIGAAIRAASAQVSASDDLRARITQDRLRGAHARRRRFRPAVLAAGGALAALAVALVIVLAPGSPGAPSVAGRRRGCAERAHPAGPGGRPERSALRPRVHGRHPLSRTTPTTRAGGRSAGGSDTLAPPAVADGDLRARIGPRGLHDRRRAAPDGAARRPRRRIADGTPVWVARLDGALVVSWERAGHTCVLASRRPRCRRCCASSPGATRRSARGGAGPAAPARGQLTMSVPFMPGGLVAGDRAVEAVGAGLQRERCRRRCRPAAPSPRPCRRRCPRPRCRGGRRCRTGSSS